MDNSALFKLSYGLYVLSAWCGQRDNACIVNTVMQVTSNPLQIVVGLNKQNYTHDMILRSGRLNVSILNQQAPFELFQRFGFQSGRTVDKFNHYNNAARSDNGLIYLPEYTSAYLSGHVLDQLDFSTHTLFRAEVTDAQVLSDVPSLTYEYYQTNIKPKPTAAAKTSGWRCKVCGYVYEGETLPEDYICPLCGHGTADFEKI